MLLCLHEFILVVSSEDFTQMVKYVRSEEVSTSVDCATDKCPWLFNIVKNLGMYMYIQYHV